MIVLVSQKCYIDVRMPRSRRRLSLDLAATELILYADVFYSSPQESRQKCVAQYWHIYRHDTEKKTVSSVV